MRTTISLFILIMVSEISLAAEIRAFGKIDIPGAQISDLEQEPEIPDDPFDRSIVSVSRGGNASGVTYGYFASSDIGLGELKAVGSLTNSSGDELSSIETGLLAANARLEDTITIESTSTEDYEVIYEFHVDGLTDFSGGAGFAGANLITGVFGHENDSLFTTISQTIDETLTVTRTYNGTVEQNITLQLFLQLNIANGGGFLTADLGNTATLNIILPQEATITASESGTFLEVITPIPVPPMLPLVLILSGWLATQRRTKTASLWKK